MTSFDNSGNMRLKTRRHTREARERWNPDRLPTALEEFPSSPNADVASQAFLAGTASMLLVLQLP